MHTGPVVLPDLVHVSPAVLKRGHIVRVTSSDTLSATDAYGIVRACKKFPSGWRIRWDAATTTADATGILHVPEGLVSCVPVHQWVRMVHTRAAELGRRG
ncbi:hypothetical protein [Nonomuraea salmonea]|uniref:Uncharacterized protein n=1 Tax=Nonomuraea salmonea TaxID=46181 RepID=A0ABV5P2W7_9ACTN